MAQLSVSSVALKRGVRDRWIGWNFRSQYGRRRLIANNSRFLILPQGRWPNVGSRAQSSANAWPGSKRNLQRLRGDRRMRERTGAQSRLGRGHVCGHMCALAHNLMRMVTLAPHLVGLGAATSALGEEGNGLKNRQIRRVTGIEFFTGSQGFAESVPRYTPSGPRGT